MNIIRNFLKVYLLFAHVSIFSSITINPFPKSFSKEQWNNMYLRPIEYELRTKSIGEKGIIEERIKIKEESGYNYSSKKFKELDKQFEIWEKEQLGFLKDMLLYAEQKINEYKSMLCKLETTYEEIVLEYTKRIIEKKIEMDDITNDQSFISEEYKKSLLKYSNEKNELEKEFDSYKTDFNQNKEIIENLINKILNKIPRINGENYTTFILNTKNIYKNRALIYENFGEIIYYPKINDWQNPIEFNYLTNDLDNLVYYQMIVASYAVLEALTKKYSLEQIYKTIGKNIYTLEKMYYLNYIFGLGAFYHWYKIDNNKISDVTHLFQEITESLIKAEDNIGANIAKFDLKNSYIALIKNGLSYYEEYSKNNLKVVGKILKLIEPFKDADEFKDTYKHYNALLKKPPYVKWLAGGSIMFFLLNYYFK